jgi:hypothetical protein
MLNSGSHNCSSGLCQSDSLPGFVIPNFSPQPSASAFRLLLQTPATRKFLPCKTPLIFAKLTQNQHVSDTPGGRLPVLKDLRKCPAQRDLPKQCRFQKDTKPDQNQIISNTDPQGGLILILILFRGATEPRGENPYKIRTALCANPFTLTKIRTRRGEGVLLFLLLLPHLLAQNCPKPVPFSVPETDFLNSMDPTPTPSITGHIAPPHSRIIKPSNRFPSPLWDLSDLGDRERNSPRAKAVRPSAGDGASHWVRVRGDWCSLVPLRAGFVVSYHAKNMLTHYYHSSINEVVYGASYNLPAR